MASVKELPSKPSYTTCSVTCILPHFDPHRNILHHLVTTISPQTATKTRRKYVRDGDAKRNAQIGRGTDARGNACGTEMRGKMMASAGRDADGDRRRGAQVVADGRARCEQVALVLLVVLVLLEPMVKWVAAGYVCWSRWSNGSLRGRLSADHGQTGRCRGSFPPPMVKDIASGVHLLDKYIAPGAFRGQTPHVRVTFGQMSDPRITCLTISSTKPPPARGV